MAILSAQTSEDSLDESDTFFQSRFSKFIKFTVIVAFLGVICVFILAATASRENVESAFESSRMALSLKEYAWTAELIQSFDDFHIWLQRHGLSLEVVLFEKLGTIIFSSAAILRFNQEGVGVLPSSFISLHFIFIRVGFFLLCSWRLWFFAAIVGFFYSKIKIRSHHAADLLGETGNGRIFDSSISLNFDDLDKNGRSKRQLTGLACPYFVSAETVRKSALFALLDNFGAVNKTNYDLLGIILYYHSLPGYLIERDAVTESEKVLSNYNLPEIAEKWLQTTLNLQTQWKENVDNEKINAIQIPADKEQSFEEIIEISLRRVLTNEQKEMIAECSSALIATLVLSYIAARALTFERNGDRWVCRSKFPELAARSILYSLPTYTEEYSSQERKYLQRSFVYASRKNEFARLHLPSDLDSKNRALRIWSELIAAPALQLVVSADRIELFSLIEHYHNNWLVQFSDELSKNDSEILTSAIVSSDFLFIPLEGLLKTFEKIIDLKKLKRLEYLLSLQRQREAQSAQLPQPLDFLQLKELSRSHQVSEDNLKLWSTYRIVLSRHGWLGLRILDQLVADHALIFATFLQSKPEMKKEIIGRSGLIGLKISKLESQLGVNWGKSFNKLDLHSVMMTREEFEKALSSKETLTSGKSIIN